MDRQLCVLAILVCLSSSLLDRAIAQPNSSLDLEVGTQSPFAKSNLHVWAYEEYDSVNRSPIERASLLQELGITKAGYICRNAARASEFEQYVQAYKQKGIDLVAVWTPVNTQDPLEEPQIKTFLEVVDRHQLKLQWWMTLEEDFDAMPEGTRIDHAVTRLLPLVDEADKRQCRLVVYGHGPTRWFAQCENEIAIVERLKAARPNSAIGIVYSFHQSHAQMARLQTVFPSLQPHLVAINLNGMHSNGPRIDTIGNGDQEEGMIKTIFQSKWQGPVGILDHQRTKDAKVTLQANLDGLESILRNIGDDSALSTY